MQAPEKTLNLMITPDCNLKCEFCYSLNDNDIVQHNKDKFMTNELWSSLLEEARMMGYCHLHIFGGEPFLSPQLKHIVEHASSVGYDILIATNGISFKEDDFQWLKENPVIISFTINKIDKIVKNLDLLPENKRKNLQLLKKHKIPVSIATCLTSENIHYYYEFVDILNKRFNDDLSFFGIYFSRIGRGSNLKKLQVSNDLWWEFIEKKPTDFPGQIEMSILPINKVDEFIGLIPFGCQILNGNMLTIDYLGRIFPCFLFVSQPKFSLNRYSKQGDFLHTLGTWGKSWIPNSKMGNNSENNEDSNCNGGCPAYKIENDLDFRCESSNSEKYYFLCPLISL